MSLTNNLFNPRIGAAQIKLLERLCSACAVSGDEGEVRVIVKEQLRSYSNEVKTDVLGNVLVTRIGQGEERARVMLTAHMDEVGFMITHDDGHGYFRFETIGGIDERLLPGKPVWIGHQHLPGVIGIKPIHLTSDEELKKTFSIDSLRIDIGPGGDSKIKVGDRAMFTPSFKQLSPDGSRPIESLSAKALDNRLGVATLIELVKHAPSNIDLLAAFTVQEEIGARGARVAAYNFHPDLAIVIDSTPAMDLPTWDGIENAQYNTHLGAGPAIYIADNGTLSDPRLVRHLVETAEKFAIPFQMRQPGRGSTDAGAVHRVREGIPSISVSIPSRYAHTPAGLCRISDWKNTYTLLYRALSCLTLDILAGKLK